jgi:surface antigen
LTSRSIACVALLTLVALSAPVSASNIQFLRDAPIAKMTKEDLALFQTNMREALEQDPDGTTRRWENPNTGASGTLTPVSTSEQNGVKCRRLDIVNTVQGLTARSTFNMCRQADGTWVSSTPPKR